MAGKRLACNINLCQWQARRKKQMFCVQGQVTRLSKIGWANGWKKEGDWPLSLPVESEFVL